VETKRVEIQSTTAYFFKHIVKMEITLSGLGILSDHLNRLNMRSLV